MKKNSTQTHAAAAPSWLERAVAARLEPRFADLGVALRLWAEPAADALDPVPTATLNDRRALWRTFLKGPFGLADSYVAGELDLTGDLRCTLESANRAAAPDGKLGGRVRRRHRRIDRAAARANAMAHYDLGTEFYSLWLDPTMTYTCAYFADPSMTLAAAQQAKMDLVCAKLGIGAGDRVVDAGSGWGAFAFHVAERFGARVRAFNVSPAQVEYARDQAARRGLAGRVEFIEEDYRAIDGRFDVFVSIGMLEAVGKAEYETLGAVIKKGLARGGRGLIHSIGRSEPVATDAWIDRYIFPGSYKPSLAEMLGVFEPNGLAVEHVDNLRLHYVRTLEHWITGFEAAADRIRGMFDERFVRLWRLYLNAAAAAFATGWLQLYQIVFTHNGEDCARLGVRPVVSR